MNQLTPIPQNYKKNVDWIIGAYSDAGVSFAEGFQKDAIQNAAGARETKRWNNWHCDISYEETDKGSFVVIEDSGTTGLTGRNISSEEINRIMEEGESLLPEERLARFTSMFNSGGNTTGGGLYGAGKSVYSVASKKYIYYFDSLRKDGKYVANVNNQGRVMNVALEGDEAKKFILDETGLSKKTTVGTRVIIASPREELVGAIKNGDIIPFIQESWWRIIERLGDGAAITVNGNPVTVPDNYKSGSKKFETSNTENYNGRKVKHFGLYVFEDGNNPWSGISYYRKGMKIGQVDIKEIPKKLEGKFWGYIEVDESWEDELAEIEDKVHFGVSKGKKMKGIYQDLKNYCNEKFKERMRFWGYTKNRESEDQKLKEELNGIAEELQDLFDKLHFEDLGRGPKKPDFDVRWQDIHYPEEDSECVTSGDSLSFAARFKSSYTIEKNFDYKLLVINPKINDIVSKIDAGVICIKPNETYIKNWTHIISKDNSIQFSENRIVLSVKVKGSGKEKTKVLPYFFDIDKPDNFRETVNLSLHECLFPIQGSRRVNFGEAIRKVCWRIENKRNATLHYRLNVSVHNASDPTTPKIKDVASFTDEIKPFEDVITPHIEEIVFDKDTYESYLSRGVLELRARLVANKDDSIVEKGERITKFYFKIFLNMDEKNGQSDSFNPILSNAPDVHKRAWREAGNNRSITINIGHNAYKILEDYEDVRHEYLREQMLTQYVLLYLDEGKYDMFGEGFADLDFPDAIERVIQKIEETYCSSLE